MLFRSKKNRRRFDLTKKTGEVKVAARRAGPLVLHVFATITLSIGTVWGVWQGFEWARRTPRFALEHITAVGTERATAQQLSRLAGLAAGQNLVALDVAAAEKAMAAHPWVKSIRLTRRFPHAIELGVVEHQAVAMVSLGELYLVDDEGEPFKRVQASDGLDLPVVTGVDRELFAEHRDQATTRLKQAVSLLAAWQASAVGAKTALSEVVIEKDEAALTTLDGLTVRLGAGDVAAKLQRLGAVKEELAKRSMGAVVVRLDNRVRPNWVTVQLKTGPSERRARP